MFSDKSKLSFWGKCSKKFGTLKKKIKVANTMKMKIACKGTLIMGACVTSLILPFSLPIFLVVSALTKSTSYLTLPFLILDLKTIIVFIIEI